ncbi:MAG: prepilin-type N-terminal cleavage/methylation domain-containing protein [Desulfobacteraceae bacterium]|nr:prepilin-type N-terminal cleavage/methylation domain-containing protein [Desulfobacteraceae bacterium]
MKHNNDSGFTLIEVLLAVALLSVGLLALGIMQAHFAAGNANSRQLIYATDVATNKIEELANITDSTDSDLSFTDPGDPNDIHTETNTDYPLDYVLEWDVIDNGDQTRTIVLTVRWSTGGRNHEVNMNWVKGF